MGDTSAIIAEPPGLATADGSTPGSPPGSRAVGRRTPRVDPVSVSIGRPLGAHLEGTPTMPDPLFNKFRAAIEILLQGRDVMVEGLADDILANEDDLAEGGFLFNEYLEGQGTRLHFLCLLISQLEQSADSLDETL